jgi:predicted SnoaL-like aldol condensation-catalyzing enzyme
MGSRFVKETDMSSDENKALAARVYEAINAQDLATLETLFAPNIVRHAMGEIGIEPAKKAVIAAFANAPERRFIVEDLIADGDRVALRVMIYANVAAAEPQAIILEIFRFEDGRVVEIWGAGGAVRPLLTA